MTDFKPNVGGSSTNPSGTSGPSWYTSPTLKAGVMWSTGDLSTQAKLNAAHYGTGPTSSQFWLTPKQAKAQLQGFNASQQSLIQGAMRAAGIKYSASKAGTMWGKVVDYVQSLAANGQYVDPFSVLGGISSGKMQYGGGGSGGGAGGGTSISTSSSSSTSKSFQKTSADTADRLLDEVLSNYLGRTATASEKANFVSSLNKKEAATPTNVSSSSSSSRSVSSAGGSNSTSTSSNVSHSTTGVDPQEQAIQKAQSTKGYAEYQYGTTYMDAFLSALGAPVSAAGTV